MLAGQAAEPERARKPSGAGAVVRLLRPPHWLKNGFVLAALIFSRSFHDGARVRAALWAAVAFSLAASAVYIFNDLWDAASDRRHPHKRHRPLAAGEISVRLAVVVLAVLCLLLAGAVLLVPAIAGHVAAYLALGAAYTLWLKHVPWLDIVALAAGFFLRVDAGAAAIDVRLSAWMLTATVALALFLAALKRYSELASHGDGARPALAGYRASHLRRAVWVSGAAALGCYALFVVVARHALAPTLAPVALGMARYYWLVVHREGGDSPFRLIAHDPWLLLAAAVWVAASIIGLW
jgi:decaprenyl-phosphate phosphoribosyltransferase